MDNNKDLKIQLGNGVNLVAFKGDSPFDREFSIYLEKDGTYQDLARVGMEYSYIDEDKIKYTNDKVSVKVYADYSNEDFTDDFIVNVIDELTDNI